MSALASRKTGKRMGLLRVMSKRLQVMVMFHLDCGHSCMGKYICQMSNCILLVCTVYRMSSYLNKTSLKALALIELVLRMRCDGNYIKQMYCVCV